MDILCKSGVKVDKFTVIVDISKFVGFIHIYTSLSTSPVNIPSYEQLYQQYVDNFIHDLFITYIWIIFNSIIQWNGVSYSGTLSGRKSMDAIKENWTTVKEAVRREYSLSDISYHTWVEPLEFHNVVNDVVSIIIPSDQAHALNYISSKYKSFFR